MASGWRYRVASILGMAGMTTAAVVVANLPVVQETFALVPFFGNPAPVVLSNGELQFTLWTVLAVVALSAWPLHKPRPRRILDTVLVTQKRVLLAMTAMAALGYFNWTYRLPRSTLMLTTVVLLVGSPVWFLLIRRQPTGSSRAVIVGDDPRTMQDILAATDLPVLGYVSPPSSYTSSGAANAEPVGVSDGGVVAPQLEQLSCLGGLSRLDEVFLDYDVDTALLAFAETDRGEFFGTLDACAEHGVAVLVHRDHADDVLAAERAGGDLLEVDLEPWDWQDYLVKRLFDLAFAVVGLLVLLPVISVIAATIKLDSSGPVLYSQERTAEFGDTFTVYKFRSMVPGAEAGTGARLSEQDAGDRDPRVTRVGQILRMTHLDEIPQLWSVLVGDMSVVGPRPERPELDREMETGATAWRSRWFVKPGLTGLAQINGATGHDPEAKLRYDVEYIRRQSFWYDLKIVIRQVWQVFQDVARFVTGSEDTPE